MTGLTQYIKFLYRYYSAENKFFALAALNLNLQKKGVFRNFAKFTEKHLC